MAFEKVDPSRRGDGRLRNPAMKALLDGETILVPYGTATGGLANTALRHGKRLHQHRAVDGIVLWLTDRGTSDGSY